MTIAAANVAPDFAFRRSITAGQLRHLSDPSVIFEDQWCDSDGEKCWAYTVAGWLDGVNVASVQGGVTVGGEVIIVHADSRQEADELACMGLSSTVNGLDDEETAYIEAHAAQARLASVGALRRVELATAPEISHDFAKDAQLIEKLRGDDVILTTGH